MEACLTGERIYLPDGHFDEETTEILLHHITALGAAHISDRQQATIVLLNPSSSSYKGRIHNIALISAAYPDSRQLPVPYHWLSLCLHRGVRVDETKLDCKVPVFINPNTKQPLRAWVSLNVIKRSDEPSPELAHQNTTDMLVRGGALIVKKRAQADLLIIDPSSKFFITVKAEKEKHKRDHQKLAERDWVEDCYKNKKVAWQSERDLEEAPPSEAESFKEEPVPEKKRPGMPAGRMEYTPADDDFLLRYLAAHYSHGSWGSAATYKALGEDIGRYPIVDNHPWQSWRERFKKNAGVFDKRVKEYIKAGIDDSLKTKEERNKIKARERAAAADTARSTPPAGVQRPDNARGAGPSRIPIPRPPARDAPAAARKTLVGSDTESPAPTPAVAGPSAIKQVAAPPTSSTANAAPTAAAETTGGPSSSDTAGPSRAQETFSDPTGTADLGGDSMMVDESLQAESAYEPTDFDQPQHNVDEYESQQVDYGATDPAPDQQSSSRQDVNSQPPVEESQASGGSGERRDFAGEETQAVLGDFGRVQAAVMAKKAEQARKAEEARVAVETRRAEEARQAEQARLADEARQADIAAATERARVEEAARVAEQASGAEHARKAAEARAVQEARQKEEARLAQIAKEKEDARVAAEAVALAQAAEAARPQATATARASPLPRSSPPARSPSHGPVEDLLPPSKRARHTAPANQYENGQQAAVHTDMPAPTSTSRTARISQATDGSGRRRISVPVELKFRVVSHPQDGSTEEDGEEEIVKPIRHPRISKAMETPSPGSNRRPHRESSSRRRSRLPHHQSPDTVYASPAVPVFERPAPAASPSVHHSGGGRGQSSPPPPMSDRERHNRILEGQAAAREKAEAYKARIREMCAKYGVTPGEISGAVDAVKKKKETALSWEEIGRRLDEYYQLK